MLSPILIYWKARLFVIIIYFCCTIKTTKLLLTGCAKSSGSKVGRVPGQGRDRGLAADGRQPRADPDVQDPVQHVLHAGHLGNGNRLEWGRRWIHRFVVLINSSNTSFGSGNFVKKIFAFVFFSCAAQSKKIYN